MTAQRLTDAQIAAALRAHLPAHARSDIRGRIRDEVATVRQARPMPILLDRLTDADPVARRRAVLLAAAALLALGVALVAVVGALNRKDDPLRITADPARDAALFVEQAYTAHRDLPAMTVIARLWDLKEGPTDVQRFVFDGDGSVRHECCDGTIIINTRESSGTTNMTLDNEIVWVVGPPIDQVAGWELATYSRLDSPRCPTAWQYVGAETLLGRGAHHFACTHPPEGDVVTPPQEYWLDAELGIVLKFVTWGIQMDENNEPLEPYGSAMEVDSITFGEPPPDAFDPPPGMAVMTSADFSCSMDESSCGATPQPPGELAPTPETIASDVALPDLDTLVAATLANYAGPPAMRIEIWDAYVGPEHRYYADGRGAFREEYAFAFEHGPTVDIVNDDGWFESWASDESPKAWRRMGEPGPYDLTPRFTLGMPATCEKGWTFVGVDLVNGSEAWHLSCDRVDYWIDRARLLVVRRVDRPDVLSTGPGEVQTVVTIELGPQDPELFELPDDAELLE